MLTQPVEFLSRNISQNNSGGYILSSSRPNSYFRDPLYVKRRQPVNQARSDFVSPSAFGMASSPAERQQSGKQCPRTSTPEPPRPALHDNLAFDQSPPRSINYNVFPISDSADVKSLYNSPISQGQGMNQSQLGGVAFARNEEDLRVNFAHIGGESLSSWGNAYSTRTDPLRNDQSQTIHQSPLRHHAYADHEVPQRSRLSSSDSSPRHCPRVAHNSPGRHAPHSNSPDSHRAPHPTVTEIPMRRISVTSGARPPLHKKMSEDGEDSVHALIWDSGFGAYVPRSSVEQPKVYIRVVFLKIGEIDTLKEQFRAEVFIQARWREPQLDNCSGSRMEEILWDELWNPQLQLENAMDEPRTTIWHDISMSETGEAFVLEKRRVKADFAETLELQNFPFDVQHLSILITSQLSDTSLELLEDDKELSSVNLLSFVDEQEWDVRRIVEAKVESRSREFTSIKHNFPLITVRTYAIRRSGFFVWNVLAIMILICSLSLCTFAVSRSLPQNRLQLSFTLVLTGIAFKFVVGQSLPKIPYLTVLDKYILGSMVLMHMVSVWHAVVTRLHHDDELAETMDDWAFVFLVILFSFYNISFGLIMLYKVCRKRNYVGFLEADYQAKVEKMRNQSGDSQGRVMKKNKRLTSRLSSKSRINALT